MPAAGLRWLLAVSPAHFAQQPALSRFWERWWSGARARAFIEQTGIDLARTEWALMAGFDLGTLYMVDAAGWISAPEQRFMERLAGSERIRRPHPELWHISGLVGSTPQAMVRVDNDFLAVAVGDPRPARVVELRARGRLPRFVPALESAALSSLPGDILVQGPWRLYALGPFRDDDVAKSAGLIATAHAIAVSIDVVAPDTVAARVVFGGSFRAGDEQRLLALWNSVAQSPEGLMVQLPPTPEVLQVGAGGAHLELCSKLRLEPVLSGLESLFARDWVRYLEDSPASQPN